MQNTILSALLSLAVWLAASLPLSAADSLRFEITLDPAVAKQPASGRLFVFLSQNPNNRREPRFGPNWFNPEPFFGLDAKDVKPGETRTLDEQADGFPGKLSKLPAGKYRAQALLHHDFYSHAPGEGVGNFYSDVQSVDLDPARPQAIAFKLDRVVQPQPFPESPPESGTVYGIRELLAALDGEGEPAGGVRIARASMEMILGFIASHRAGGARLPLPLSGADRRLTVRPDGW